MAQCKRCGYCCWEWRTGDPQKRCQYLARDLRTCTVYDRRGELALDCVGFPHDDVRAAPDLPDHCAFMEEWRKAGLI